MPPRDHVGVVVCGTRRAEAWRAAFADAGIPAVVDETDGDESEQGACKVSVPRARMVEANALITAVTRGERRLPGGGGGGVTATIAVLAIAAFVAALLRGWL
ncbi:MAG: hypothetical protein H6709_11580 [Kofleriaceae bacterium]|nr:hypothetical protein [Kofleriaceae bacterium]MCB9572716.1 hypothetical protein [Kofleriaceae bacterium]